MGGLWKPRDHEKSAIKEKTQKADYREDFDLPIVQKLPKHGLLGRGIRISAGMRIIRTPEWYRLQARQWKDQILRELRRITNRYPILVDDRKFVFKWKLDDFAKANALSQTQAASIFPAVRREAVERRSMVERRLARAELATSRKLDPETSTEVKIVELEFRLSEITDLLPFADGFRIEEEFFAEKQAENKSESEKL